MLLQTLEQLLEQLAGVRVEKIVLTQTLHARAEVGGQAVELGEPVARELVQQLAEHRVGGSRRRVFVDLAKPPLDAGTFEVDDLVQLLANVVEARGQVVATLPLFPRAAHPLEQLAQAHRPAAAGELRAVLQETAERTVKAALIEQLVREVVDQVVGGERFGLGTVPATVPNAHAGARTNQER